MHAFADLTPTYIVTDGALGYLILYLLIAVNLFLCAHQYGAVCRAACRLYAFHISCQALPSTQVNITASVHVCQSLTY